MGRDIVNGPYRHRQKWRVNLIRGADGARSAKLFPTEREALAFIQACLREIGEERIPLTVGKALDDYEVYLRAKGNKPESIQTTRYRMEALLKPVLGRWVKGIVRSDANRLYEALTKKTKTDTHRNSLAEAKTFWKWLVKKGHARENIFSEVEPVGRRSKGKGQLTNDEATRLLGYALGYADPGRGDAGHHSRDTEGGARTAVAAGLLLGLRSSELVKRRVRDLDRAGSVLRIPESKTRAGERVVRIPQILQGPLKALAAGKKPDDLLFGYHDRGWVRKQTAKLCRLAGVPVVTAHGLRGTHATLAMDEGMSGEAVARSLGHASARITRDAYALPGAGEAAENERRMRRLGDKPGDTSTKEHAK